MSKAVQIVLIVIGAIIIVGGGFFAYSYFVKERSPISVVTGRNFNSECKYKDPELCKFINNWTTVKYLTMTSTSVESGKTSKAVFKMDNDNTQMILEDGAGKENYNTISLGDTTYTKDYTDNKWFVYKPKADDSKLTEDINLDFDDKATETEDKTTYNKIGQEACGKLMCLKYEVKYDPKDSETTEFIWFDNKDYLLRKTLSVQNGLSTESIYDYNKISISAPSPTKEGNPYESLFNSANPDYSGTAGTGTATYDEDINTSLPSSLDDVSFGSEDTPTSSEDIPIE